MIFQMTRVCLGKCKGGICKMPKLNLNEVDD